MCDDKDIGSKKDIYDSSEEIGDIDSRLIDYFLDTIEKERIYKATAVYPSPFSRTSHP